jgi:hypothetical protein
MREKRNKKSGGDAQTHLIKRRSSNALNKKEQRTRKFSIAYVMVFFKINVTLVIPAKIETCCNLYVSVCDAD